MKKILLGLILILTSIGIHAQTNYQKGVIRGTSSDNTTITGMEFDSYNYQILFGKFYDSVNVAPFTAPATLFGGSSGANVHNAYFAAYDDYGYLMFAHKLGNLTDSVTIKAATFTNFGDIVIVGSFKGAVDFADNVGNPYVLTSVGTGSNGFIAYYDYMGNFNAAAVLECTSGNAIVNDVRLNSNDEIIVVGQFNGTIDMDPSGNIVPFTSTGTDGFVATYSSYISSHVSSVQFSGAGNQVPTHVLTDYTDITVAGYFTNQFDFDFSAGVSSLPSNGNKDVFMIHSLNNYDIIDSIIIGGAGNDILKDWVWDGTGYKLLMDFEQTVNFNPQGPTTNLISSGLSDVALVSYGKFFEFNFVKKFGNSNADKGYLITPNNTSYMMQKSNNRSVNANNDYILSMGFIGTVDFNPDPIETATSTSSNTPLNSAVVNLDSLGTYLRHGSIEAKSIVGYRPAGSSGNDVIMAGNFTGSQVDMLVFDDTSSLSHSGVNSGFYMHYNRCLMQVSHPYFVEPYECGTCTAKLGIDVISGGMAPYTYEWNNYNYYSTDEYATEVCPDNTDKYYVTVSDFYGCVAFDTIWVRTHPIGFELEANLTVTQTSCGNNFGSADAIPVNNLGNVSYYWSDGTTNSSVDSLEVGNYFLQLKDDSLHCYFHKNFFIDASDGPVITLNSSADPICGNTNNGAIDVTVTGGVGPYTYLWTNGATTEDITGLSGGTYTLTVTDATGCENSICVSLYQPQAINAYQLDPGSSNCGFNNGAMYIESYGGTGSHTYLWDANAGFATNDTVYNLFAGIYTVTVTDSLGCTANIKFGISDMEWYGPGSYFGNIIHPDCAGSTSYIDVITFTYSPLQQMTYLWDTGETTEDLVGGVSGSHFLQITDDAGCVDVAEYGLNQILPVTPTICMVTVDSTGTQNVVVWDKSSNPNAAYYNIYREGFCNQLDFGIVGSVDFDSLSVFYDTVVNSDTRTWKYYVTAVDTCGFESAPSEIHRTIHLSSQVDTDTNIVLDWSSYQGMDISGYKIYRRQPASLNYDFVDSVGPLTTNYLDTIDFSAYTIVEYYVDALPVSVCNASRAYNQNEARSNHSRNAVPKDTSTIGVEEVMMETSIELYPNPTNDMVNLKVNSESKNWKIQLLDQTGRVVMNGQVRERAAFSTKDIQSGVYFVRMTSDKNEIHTMKLMIVH